MAVSRLKPIHPGEVLLEEFIKPFGLQETELAIRTGIEQAEVEGLLNMEGHVTADHALRLAKYFGTSPEFWLGLQADYDLDIAKAKIGDKLEKEIVPLAA